MESKLLEFKSLKEKGHTFKKEELDELYKGIKEYRSNRNMPYTINNNYVIAITYLCEIDSDIYSRVKYLTDDCSNNVTTNNNYLLAILLVELLVRAIDIGDSINYLIKYPQILRCEMASFSIDTLNFYIKYRPYTWNHDNDYLKSLNIEPNEETIICISSTKYSKTGINNSRSQLMDHYFPKYKGPITMHLIDKIIGNDITSNYFSLLLQNNNKIDLSAQDCINIVDRRNIKNAGYEYMGVLIMNHCDICINDNIISAVIQWLSCEHVIKIIEYYGKQLTDKHMLLIFDKDKWEKWISVYKYIVFPQEKLNELINKLLDGYGRAREKIIYYMSINEIKFTKNYLDILQNKLGDYHNKKYTRETIIMLMNHVILEQDILMQVLENGCKYIDKETFKKFIQKYKVTLNKQCLINALENDNNLVEIIALHKIMIDKDDVLKLSSIKSKYLDMLLDYGLDLDNELIEHFIKSGIFTNKIIDRLENGDMHHKYYHQVFFKKNWLKEKVSNEELDDKDVLKQFKIDQNLLELRRAFKKEKITVIKKIMKITGVKPDGYCFLYSLENNSSAPLKLLLDNGYVMSQYQLVALLNSDRLNVYKDTKDAIYLTNHLSNSILPDDYKTMQNNIDIKL